MHGISSIRDAGLKSLTRSIAIIPPRLAPTITRLRGSLHPTASSNTTASPAIARDVYSPLGEVLFPDPRLSKTSTATFGSDAKYSTCFIQLRRAPSAQFESRRSGPVGSSRKRRRVQAELQRQRRLWSIKVYMYPITKTNFTASGARDP